MDGGAVSMQHLRGAQAAQQTHLEHLDEGHAEVEVRQVAADQAEAEAQADGHDGAQIDASRHLDRLAAVEEGGVAGQQLRHQGREGLVVGREDDGVACRERVSDLVAHYPPV